MRVDTDKWVRKIKLLVLGVKCQSCGAYWFDYEQCVLCKKISKVDINFFLKKLQFKNTRIVFRPLTGEERDTLNGIMEKNRKM